MARDLMLTPTEYAALLRLIGSERESEGSSITRRKASTSKRKRRKTPRDRIMSRSMKKANAKAKLKGGAWRKGWNARRMMKEAHRLTRLAMR